MGMILEAIPFVLLWVIASSLLHVYMSPDRLAKYFPKNKFLGLLWWITLGLLFPVCECGNIPVARRLIAKKITPSVAITFLLSAPVFNPLTLYVTYIAFQNNIEMLYLRVALTLFIAVFTGYVFSFVWSQDEILQASFSQSIQREREEILTTSFSPMSQKKNGAPLGKFVYFIDTLMNEFLAMMSLLAFWALISSFVQVLIPRSVITSLGRGPISSIFAMMTLAFTISICSNVDAFFALSYANHFTFASILAFLVFGPMIDIKTLFMMKSIFKTKIVLYLTLLTFGLTFLFTLFMNLNIS